MLERGWLDLAYTQHRMRCDDLRPPPQWAQLSTQCFLQLIEKISKKNRRRTEVKTHLRTNTHTHRPAVCRHFASTVTVRCVCCALSLFNLSLAPPNRAFVYKSIEIQMCRKVRVLKLSLPFFCSLSAYIGADCDWLRFLLFSLHIFFLYFDFWFCPLPCVRSIVTHRLESFSFSIQTLIGKKKL